MTDTETITFERLRLAYDRLPRLHQGIFSAVHHDRLSFAEIGERIGRPAGQVRVILADAFHRLRVDVWEQEQGIAIGPIHRFLRERRQDLRLQFRLWRARS